MDVGFDPDDPASAFRLLMLGVAEGVKGALLTITAVIGGGPRAVGTHMAVLEDGRYCGHISGGCIEAAVASEAIVALRNGADTTLRFGAGSRFVDIRLPCGGGLDVHVHVCPSPALMRQALEGMSARRVFALVVPALGHAPSLAWERAIGERVHWADGQFIRPYHPMTRLVLIGAGYELEAMAAAGMALGYEVSVHLTALPRQGRETASITAERHTATPESIRQARIDSYTAVALLLHDREREDIYLRALLNYSPFYFGALGSVNAHRKRIERAAVSGLLMTSLAQIKAPIGSFGPARTAKTLAISVLADIAIRRMELDGC